MSDPSEFPPTVSRKAPDSTRIFNVPGVVSALVLVLAGIHFVVLILPPEGQWALIQHFSVRPLAYKAVLDGSASLSMHSFVTWVVPLVSYAFLHGSLTHLGFNAIWLVALGTPIARRIGAIRFLAFFFLTSILGIVVYIAIRLSSDIPVVGASGGISGLMGGLGRLMFAPKGYDPLRKRVAALTDRRVLIFAVILTISNAVVALGAFDVATNGAAVAWQVHVAGFFAGLLLYGFFDDGRPRDWPPLYRLPRTSA